jgi:hypothetical protein
MGDLAYVGTVWVMGTVSLKTPFFPPVHTAFMRRGDYGAYNSWRADSTRSRNWRSRCN